MAVRKRKGEPRSPSGKHQSHLQSSSPSSPHANGKASRASRRRSVESSWILSFPWTSLLFSLAFFTLGILTPILVSDGNNRHSGDGSRTSSSLPDSSNGLETLEAGDGMPLACTDDNLHQFLHDEPQLGMHVVCVTENDGGQLSLQFFKNAYYAETDAPIVDGLLSPVPWSNLEMIFRSKLGLQSSQAASGVQHGWSVYSTRGERVVSEHEKEAEIGQVSHLMSNKFGVVILLGQEC